MTSKNLICALAVAIVAFAGMAQATAITWGTQQPVTTGNVTTPDVDTNGVYFDAVHFGNPGASATVNGVPFNGSTLSAGVVGDALITNTGGHLGGPGTFYTGQNAAGNTDTNYHTILDGGLQTYSGNYSSLPGPNVTISGLTNGNLYRVQVWNTISSTNDMIDGTAGLMGDHQPANPYGSYIIGNFTAVGTTQSFRWATGGDNGGITAVSVRDLTLTPEPSTIVLLVTALLGLLAYAWRKRK